MLDWLNRRIGRYAVPKLGPIIVLLQGVVYAASLAPSPGRPTLSELISLDLDRVRSGEVWRLLTFVVVPPLTNPICLLFGLYFFWLMSSALESQWGSFRFNVYLAVGWAMTVATAIAMEFLAPALVDANPQNTWLLGSVFLAFAWLWPNFTILLFLIIPVQVKYLALITWLVYLATLCAGSWLERGLVVAATSNFLLFFAADILRRMRRGHRQMAAKIIEVSEAQDSFHRCAICGVTERSDPSVRYRTCVECRPAHEYCMAHLKEHRHVSSP